MKQLADGVHMLGGFPPNAINVFLLGDVLLDASTRYAGRRILRQVRGRPIAAHALTHAHPDHQGASHQLCETLGIPLWCGDGDAEAMEHAGAIRRGQPRNLINGLIDRAWTGPPHPVARRLRDGDDVAGFAVLETPGHSRGHVSYWRERDRVLVCGDVLNGMNLLTMLPGLHEPPAAFTPDPGRNRKSIQRLAALEPSLICFGHGPPLRDPGQLTSFAASLPL